MVRQTVLAAILMLFCCTALVAQERGAPVGVGAATSAISLAKAAQRANAELASGPAGETKASTAAETQDGGRAGSATAASDDDGDRPKSKKDKKHLKRRKRVRNALIVVGALAVVAVVACELIDSSESVGWGFP